MFNQLFSATNHEGAVSGANQLAMTAQLTQQAYSIVNSILKAVEHDDDKKPLVQASMTDHAAMDKLIAECINLDEVDISYLLKENEIILDNMIKSQQSKRSRAKSKVMTMENYTSMMTGAVAENLLRIVAGKPKGATGSVSRGNETTYTEEELQSLAADQEMLKKAIRNVQSKKSIAKSKAAFDETSDKWQQLLVAEEQLKSIRIEGAVTNNQKAAVTTVSKLDEMLASIEDIDKLKSADAKEVLNAIKGMLATK